MTEVGGRGLGSSVGVVAATIVAAVLVCVFPESPASASCAIAPPVADFEGPATAIDESRVAFQVDQVFTAPPDDRDTLAPGRDIVVELDDAGALTVGTIYRVRANRIDDAWSSRVSPAVGAAGADECDSRLTTLADGTPVGRNWFVRHDVGRWAITILIAMVGLIVVVESAHIVRRRRHRRLDRA